MVEPQHRWTTPRAAQTATIAVGAIGLLVSMNGDPVGLVIGLVLALGACTIIVSMHWPEVVGAFGKRQWHTHLTLPAILIVATLLVGGYATWRVLNPQPQGWLTVLEWLQRHQAIPPGPAPHLQSPPSPTPSPPQKPQPTVKSAPSSAPPTPLSGARHANDIPPVAAAGEEGAPARGPTQGMPVLGPEFTALMEHPGDDAPVQIQIRAYGEASRPLGQQIATALQGEGWAAFDFGMDGGTRTFSGVLIAVRDPTNPPPVVARLTKAFNAIGVYPALEAVPVWPDNFVRIGIGSF